VLSLTLDRDSGEILGAEPGGEGGEVALNPLDPCGACMEWLKKARARVRVRLRVRVRVRVKG